MFDAGIVDPAKVTRSALQNAVSIEDLPKVLIQKRISLGMTQKELAAKLGIKEQMVQRYEASGYESIGFQRLAEVWNALSASIPVMTVS
jgi:DNA-binding XRE family transcriptional regulator